MSTDLEPSDLTPWWRPLARSDRWALLWFVIIPSLFFIVPALLGHPAIDADNLIQNFPLRVLAGRQLATGHLPLLDPLTNSGTPLLGGMNAGALYPLTLIFAFIPPLVAWVFNMIVVYVTGAVGMFALLRWHRVRTAPAFAAGISYAYCGAMIGQMVHLGVIQGYSFIPWGMLLMVALSRRLTRVGPEASILEFARVGLPWALGVAALWGLTFLSGEPRTISSIELLTIVVVPCVLILRSSYWMNSWRLRVAYVATLAVGFVWGLGIGLIQLLPGWSFIHYSERNSISYAYFGAGSLAARWSALLFTPDLFGGNGAFGQPGFFANYNLAEVTGYAGVLALVAGVAFLTRVRWRGWRGEDRDYTIYLVILVVGLFATWGNFTPLGHIFHKIPLYGSTRLQSRSVILVDFPLSVFLGWWLQRIREGAAARAGLGKWSRWVTAAPALVIVVGSALLLGWGPWVLNKIHISGGNVNLEEGLKTSNALHLIIALAAALAVLLLARHSKRLFSVLMVVLVADLVVFLLFTSSGLIGGQGPREASESFAQRLLGNNGRFALVDAAGAHTGVYRELGEPNMNVFTNMASVQGYGSLISNIYDDATGTHPQAALNACHLAAGTFTQLRLGAIAISSSQLMTSTAFTRSVPHGCVKQTAAPSLRRYFGEVLPVGLIHLTGVRNEMMSSSTISIQLLDAKGHVIKGHRWTFPGGYIRGVADFAGVSAAGILVSSPTGVTVGDTVVTPSDSKSSYRLDTNFQLAIATTKWKLTSTEDTFSVFKATRLVPRAWLVTPSSGTVTKIRTAEWGDAWVSVILNSASALERSEAYLPGWRATAVNDTTGKVEQLKVMRAGLIEKVDVPEGKWVIHFHYHAPYIEVSTAVSAVSLVLWLGVSSGLLIRKRRKRKTKVLS
jgi:branched-subunit amino acid transport protein AzlD